MKLELWTWFRMNETKGNLIIEKKIITLTGKKRKYRIWAQELK
jgi:hypothetical protein